MSYTPKSVVPLPGCMVGPSDPCEAFTALQAAHANEIESLKVKLKVLRHHAECMAASIEQEYPGEEHLRDYRADFPLEWEAK